jgi:hypothetical protein
LLLSFLLASPTILRKHKGCTLPVRFWKLRVSVCILTMSWLSIVVVALTVAVSSAAGASFQVEVGQNATLTFNPETIVAQPGDTVTYNFHPKVGYLFSNSLKKTRIDFIRITPSHSLLSRIHVIPLLAECSLDLYQLRISQLPPLQLSPLQSMTQPLFGSIVVRQLGIIASQEWYMPSMRTLKAIFFT